MTATDVLRKRLDEFGKKYATDDTPTSCTTMWTTQNGGWMFDCDYTEPLKEKKGTIGAKTELMIYGYSPAQAIEATLGRGTCRPVFNSDRDGLPYLEPKIVCSECGCILHDSKFGKVWQSYCPNCGRKVIG